MAAVVDLTGHRFGRWQVIEQVDNHHAGTGAMWLCECDCGTRRVVASNPLRRGNSKSCGCYRRKSEFKPKPIRLLLFGGVPEVEPGSECEEAGCAEPSVSANVLRCPRHEQEATTRWLRTTSRRLAISGRAQGPPPSLKARRSRI